MSTIQQLKEANVKSQEIIQGFQAQLTGAPDVVEARVEELTALSKKDLVAMVVALEKPKVEKPFKVEDVAKALLEEPACALFTYEQIAALVLQVIPGKTSDKSIGSYASKKKEDWNIVPREKLQLSTDDLMKLAQ